MLATMLCCSAVFVDWTERTSAVARRRRRMIYEVGVSQERDGIVKLY